MFFGWYVLDNELVSGSQQIKNGNAQLSQKGAEKEIFSTLLLDWSEGSCPCALGGENSNAPRLSPTHPMSHLNNNQVNKTNKNKRKQKQKGKTLTLLVSW